MFRMQVLGLLALSLCSPQGVAHPYGRLNQHTYIPDSKECRVQVLSAIFCSLALLSISRVANYGRLNVTRGFEAGECHG